MVLTADRKLRHAIYTEEMKGERGFRRGKTSSFHSQRKPQVHVEGNLRNVSFVRSLVVSSFSIGELKAENPVLCKIFGGFVVQKILSFSFCIWVLLRQNIV